jgi:hypothetical protein
MRELLEECRSSAFDAKEYSLCDRIDAALRTPIPPIFDAFCTAREQRDEARAALTDAYRRGAEAMREQAAQRITCHFPDATADGSRCGLCHFCEAGWDQHIRALPIPEDKE